MNRRPHPVIQADVLDDTGRGGQLTRRGHRHNLREQRDLPPRRLGGWTGPSTISGAGHWFLEGWIGDHSVDFLVDSGSALPALSCNFYQALVRAGAPVGVLQSTVRRLRGVNGLHIDILGCSSCVVSFLGLRTEFPILVCDLSTDAIIGTDTLGSILPHTLDIKKGLLFIEGGVSLQLHRWGAALSGHVFMVGHCSIPPCSEAVLQCTTHTVGGRSLSSSWWWAGRWWTHQDGEFRCWYLILARRP